MKIDRLRRLPAVPGVDPGHDVDPGDTAEAAVDRQTEQYRSRHRKVKLGPSAGG